MRLPYACPPTNSINTTKVEYQPNQPAKDLKNHIQHSVHSNFTIRLPEIEPEHLISHMDVMYLLYRDSCTFCIVQSSNTTFTTSICFIISL